MKEFIFSFVTVALIAGNCIGDEAEYRITFNGGWTLQPLPGGAHFTPIIGATHASPDAIFSIGGMATQGVENVAETGSTGVLAGEINQMISEGTAGTLILRPGNIGPVAEVTVDFSASPDHSMMTMLTMIAPSPDWFVGVNSFELRPGNQWIESAVLVLNSYDGGTENGTGFSLNNPATVPQSTIQMLDTAEPTNPFFGVGSIATITITRLDANEFALGDVNQDGSVDLQDVAPFVVFLMQGFSVEADVNCDGDVNLNDVAPFVELLTGI